MDRLVKQPVKLAQKGIKEAIRLVQKPIRRGPAGAPPGSLRVDPEAPKPQIRVLCYNDDDFAEHHVSKVGDLDPLLAPWPKRWIDVDGLGDETIIREIGERFGIHPLALEDTVHVHQRAKTED